MKYMRVLDDKGKDAADDYARTTARKAIEFVAANPRIIDKADALVRITEIIVRIAASFAEAVATGDLERPRPGQRRRGVEPPTRRNGG